MSLFRLLLVCLLYLLSKSDAAILTKDLVDLSARAAELSAAVYLDGQGEPNAKIYTDEPDQALFLQEDNVCWAVFRGTTLNFEDWLQNINIFNDEVCSQAGDCCTTRRGFAQAYAETSYTVQLEQDLRNCMSNCPSCHLVLGGHSQGGAIAAVAAIALDDLNPTIITFGQPASIVGPCPPIDVDRYYRFMNTEFRRSVWSLLYDPVPFLNLADHMGHMFLLGEDPANVAYYPDGTTPGSRIGLWTTDAHEDVKYIKRLQVFMNEDSYPVGTGGWALGYPCNNDSECISPNHCVDNTCYSGLDGDPCNNGGDCDSGRCEGFGQRIWSGACEPRKPNGSWCNEDQDCISNRCSWRFKCK